MQLRISHLFDPVLLGEHWKLTRISKDIGWMDGWTLAEKANR